MFEKKLTHKAGHDVHVSPFIDHHVIKENYFDTPVFCALIRLFESSISLFLNTNTN